MKKQKGAFSEDASPDGFVTRVGVLFSFPHVLWSMSALSNKCDGLV